MNCTECRTKEDYADELKRKEELMYKREEELEKLAQQRAQAQIKRGGLEMGYSYFSDLWFTSALAHRDCLAILSKF